MSLQICSRTRGDSCVGGPKALRLSCPMGRRKTLMPCSLVVQTYSISPRSSSVREPSGWVTAIGSELIFISAKAATETKFCTKTTGPVGCNLCMQRPLGVTSHIHRPYTHRARAPPCYESERRCFAFDVELTNTTLSGNRLATVPVDQSASKHMHLSSR